MMAGGTNKTDDVDRGESRPAADSAFGERRPTLEMLQTMIRKVSQSPFHNQLQGGESLGDSSASATDARHELRLVQESISNGHMNKDKRRETSTANFDDIFVPPPDFQTSSLGFETQIKSVENGSKVLDPQKDLFQGSTTSKQGPFQTSTLPNNSSANYRETLSSSDLFNHFSPQAQSPVTVEQSPSDVASRFSFSPHSFNSVTDMKSDMLPSSPDLFKATAEEPKFSYTPGDTLETQETKQSILQPTLFTRARNLCVSPSQSPPDLTHVSTFKRPPKPPPRKRQPRKVNPPLPERPLMSEPPPLPERPQMSQPPPLPERPPMSKPSPLPERPVLPEKPPTPDKSVEPEPSPKPVVPRTPKTPESKLAEPEDSYVLQEILLIGQGMSQDEIPGAHGYTPRTTCQAALLEEEVQCRSAGLNAAPYEEDDLKPKKLTKKKHGLRQSYNKDPLDSSPWEMKEELDNVNLNGLEDRKSKKSKHKLSGLLQKSKSPNGQSDRTPTGACSDAFAEDDDCHAARHFTSPGELDDGQLDDFQACKPKKTSKLKGIKLPRSKKKNKNPAGATPISEATREAWQLAQIDERADEDLENGEEDGDTDSLMEWWYTVEQWDELPSDDENGIVQEDDSEAFTVLADKVGRGLRVFNKVFTEQAEHLWQYIMTLHATADDLKSFHKKALVAGITGGTTTAVGGVTAIAGLALAPFTFGFSLILTVVGMSVATAGGITSASAVISDNVNNMQDSKKVEIILQDYETHLLSIAKVLHFIDQGICRLRGHPFLRSGTQHYSQDWEIRRAVQIISLVDSPVRRAVEITDSAITSVQGLFKGMDKYFTKDSRELKKGCNEELVDSIKLVADILHGTLVELNTIRNGVEFAAGGL